MQTQLSKTPNRERRRLAPSGVGKTDDKHVEARQSSSIEGIRPDFTSRYQLQTLRPIVSLAFVFPLILIYELGTILWGHQGLRSGIDQWLDRILSSVGSGQQVILPLMTAAVLIIWHHRIYDRWTFKGQVILGMILESLILGTTLFFAAGACHQFAGQTMATQWHEFSWMNLPNLVQQSQWWSNTMASIGSGIYEELIFRLILLLPAIRLIKHLGATRRIAIGSGILLVSLLFTSLHYSLINPGGVPFEFDSFIFRFTASIVFCFLFLFRGFGIAVGTHVAYDILAQL